MNQSTDSRTCALIAARAADKVKASDIVVQRVADRMAETDYFVIATGTSKPQLNAIVDEVREQVREQTGRSIDNVEGRESGAWVLLDYGDFVVHVMKPETREFYRLEAVWNDAPFVDLAKEGMELEPYSPMVADVVARAGYEE
ncbi:MAG: ribosome silencing factor [Coriobacteriales bacterium]|nr:ribosome silencing factor [Coriobacteriales bacterium]